MGLKSSGIETYVELLSGERSTTHTGGVCLDYTDRLSDKARWDTESSAYTTDARRGGRDERVRAEIEVKHERISAFDKHAPTLRKLSVQEGQ